jgi:two-component system OmpR family sensor kinase
VRRSLRFRLLAVSIALAVAGMIVINVVAVVAVRNSLLERVDQELLSVPLVSSALPGGADSPLSGGGLPGAQVNAQFLNNTVITRLDGATGEVREQVAGPVVADSPRPDLATVSAQVVAGTVSTSALLTVGGVGDASYGYRVRVLPGLAGSPDVIVIAKSLADVRATVTRLAVVDALLTLLVVAVLIGVGAPVIRVGLRPLTDVERAAERIGVGDLSARAPHAEEPTEVGSLARTFNSMIDQIEVEIDARQASEDRLRRFLADASHELRTPLTSIRAYAELFRQGVLPAEPGSLQAMTRIESEATRMGLLVEDLLLLARLDQHPVLVTAPVDLGRLVAEVAADTAAAAPDHRVVADVIGRGTVRVVGDEAGVRQLVVNLFRNAVVHTPAGTTVRATVDRTAGFGRLVVADDGPGMSAATAAHAFERFYRPDTGRSRASAGTGLGLAIVESIAVAHGGRVELDTALGAGARFTVTLPAADDTSDERSSGPTANLQPDDSTP